MVDYRAWEQQDLGKTIEVTDKAYEQLLAGRKVDPYSLFPEFHLAPDDRIAMWYAAGGTSRAGDPVAKLANLATHYDRILIPIHPHPTKHDAEERMGISWETVVELIKANSDKYIPVLTFHPRRYEGLSFYDGMFETCRTLYGHYPPFSMLRVNRLQTMFACTILADLEKIPQGPARMLEALRANPEIDLLHVIDSEVKGLIGPDRTQLYDLSARYRMEPRLVEQALATHLTSLRAYGFGELARLIITIFQRDRQIRGFDEQLHACYHYLVGPIATALGGFQNYSVDDLAIMAFLRILPLMKTDINELREQNERVLLNSPGARSAITMEGYRMNVFLKGGDDLGTLNKLWELSESHKREMKILNEYRQLVSVGKLKEAVTAFSKAGEVCSQIGDEIRFWKREEKYAKFLTYSVRGGVMFLSDLGLFLAPGLPSEWRLAISLVKDVATWLGVSLDPKRIVEWAYDVPVGRWPWYQKGLPYLYWRKVD